MQILVSFGLIFLAFFPKVALACIWQNGPSPYWSSLQIPVCFNPPSAVERRNSLTDFRRAQRIIQTAYEGMSQAGSFQFVGFDLCTDESPRTQKIRIDLQETGSTGEAAGIGPGYSTAATNITMPYRMASRDGAVAPINETNLSFLIVHETLHLLGFHHDKSRDDQKYFSSLADAIVVGGFDANSAMSMELEDNNLINRNESMSRSPPYLSPGDRQCLNLLAERQIISRGSLSSEPSVPQER